MEKYKLLDLPYEYNALEPYMSKEVLTLHHDKHHAAYVNAANALLDKISDARKNNAELDYKSVLKALSFNVGGHILHEKFWKNMKPATGGENKPGGELMKMIEEGFSAQGGPASGWERFKTEFSETAKSVEGSGWAVLNGDLSIMQIEKHNVNVVPGLKILLCLDVWEHAYYLDYKNDRAKFIENWWNIVNWDEVERRFQ
jgi:Fe-Mn family superoxide dismutase